VTGRATGGGPGRGEARRGMAVERILGRAVVCLLGLSLAAACTGDPASAPLGTGPVSAESLRGSWTLEVAATSSCLPSLEAMELTLELEPIQVAGSPNEETRDYIAGRWGQAGETRDEWLQGWVERATGRVHLLLWQGVHVTGSVLDVRVVSDDVLDGWLSEPVPAGSGGYAEPFEAYPGGFTDSACAWRVTARR